jgi:hypothetical protein
MNIFSNISVLLISERLSLVYLGSVEIVTSTKLGVFVCVCVCVCV